MNVRLATALLATCVLTDALPAVAHHSYAMFDTSHSVSVSGTAAKLEWSNPHVFVWIYVPDKTQGSGYQLYAFESGSLVLLSRLGWNRNALKAGDKVQIDYVPLKSGEPGGALLKLTKADGHVLQGDPFGAKVLAQQGGK